MKTNDESKKFELHYCCHCVKTQKMLVEGETYTCTYCGTKAEKIKEIGRDTLGSPFKF